MIATENQRVNVRKLFHALRNLHVDPRSFIGSSGGREVKLLDCGARGPGFNSGLATRIFRDWLSPASKSRYAERSLNRR